MKILLPAMSILMVLFLLSCKESEITSDVQDAQPQQQKTPVSDVHTVVVQEVIQGSSYTYLKVKEENVINWIATRKTEVKTGETISFIHPLEITHGFGIVTFTKDGQQCLFGHGVLNAVVQGHKAVYFLIQ